MSCWVEQSRSASEALWMAAPYRFGTLRDLLECTTLVRIQWLVSVGKRSGDEARFGGVIPSWQQLPVSARITVRQMLATRLFGQLPVLVLSYPWLDKAHPDPHGLVLARILPFLELLARQCGHSGTVGVLWDFLSFPQRGYNEHSDPSVDDRPDWQRARFKRGLSRINEFYVHPFTIVLRVDVPISQIVAGAASVNLTPIEKRGWCIFEAQIASIVKDTRCFLSLARFESSSVESWESVVLMCRAGRSAPLDPDRLDAMMREGVADGSIVFTAGADLESIVLPNYRSGFVRAFSEANVLEYGHLGWDDDQVRSLTSTLVFASRAGVTCSLSTIALHDNRISRECAMALATALHEQKAAGTMPHLSRLILADNKLITSNSCDELAMLSAIPFVRLT